MSACEAFVTMATTDAYCVGAVVVARSLRRHGTTRRLAVLTSANISEGSRRELEQAFDEVVPVNVLDSGDRAHLSWLGRPELGITFTKLHCWTLTQYSKCVFLDADTLVLQNVDELFEREELSAAPDPGWPDCFNSGVFVFRPSLNTHARLLEHARTHGSFDGGDQGLLNTFFRDWAVRDIHKRLPFVYNLCASQAYTYLPAFQQYGHNARIVHFLGPVKPWSSVTGSHRTDESMERFVGLWWKEHLYHTSQFPPFKQHSEIVPQSQAAEADFPIREKLSFSSSLIAHFSKPDENHLSPPAVTETPQGENRPPGDEQGGSEEDKTGLDTSSSSEETTSCEEPSGSHTDPSPADAESEPLDHRRLWEEGQVDYLGRDAFHNIQMKLDHFLY